MVAERQHFSGAHLYPVDVINVAIEACTDDRHSSFQFRRTSFLLVGIRKPLVFWKLQQPCQFLFSESRRIWIFVTRLQFVVKRLTLQPRPDWQAKVAAVGLTFHTIDGATYWDESACYEFTAAEVDTLEAVGNELHARCIEAADAVIRNRWYDRLAIPPAAIPEIEASWERDDRSVYGRFDFAWDGEGAPKMLEYNADTPTALLEASVVQWSWLQEMAPENDQFNSIHERLIDAWRMYPAMKIHFAAVSDSEEDSQTALYLRDTCQQAGKDTESIAIEDVGFDTRMGIFVDANERTIEALFKLYPWEWMWSESFAEHLPTRCQRFVEPVWKMLLSNKGLLPIL
ncbi:MAG: glutathionylspermidine synthase family protein [Verrucomicrobiaceae bacterium]|nr:glutathionylspermidine synthase family protein [Verrucomicrobiaceae bacterium]